MLDDEVRNLKALIDHAGIGQSGNDHGTLMELMNLTLQCLGGIRLMVYVIEKQKTAIAAAQCNTERHRENPDDAIRVVFGSAVKRMMYSISKAAHLDDLDPSRHLVESFPHDHRIGSSQWLPIHWAMLGEDYYEKDAADATKLGPMTPESILRENNDYAQRIKLINCIVEYHPDVANQLDVEGRSIVHYAARLSSVALVECVVKLSGSPGGFGPYEPNNNGAYPLHNAARFSKSIAVLKYLLNLNPALVTVGNNDGTLPLHWAAAKNSNIEIIECLLNAYPDAIEIANHEGYLPLHSAAQNLQLHIVKAIRNAYPAAISTLDSEGGIPMHHASCFNTNIEVIKYMHSLFEKGITLAQADGITPLHLAACQNSSPVIMDYLLKKYPKAAFAVDIDGWLPLHCLLTRKRDEMTADRIQCLRLLLAANPGAVSVKRNEGQTPFEMAQICCHRRLILRLILFANPGHNTAELSRLNWNSHRRLAVLACVSLHRYSKQGGNGHFDNLFEDSRSTNLTGTEQFEKSTLYVIKRFTYGRFGESGLSLNSNLLRHIIKFL